MHTRTFALAILALFALSACKKQQAQKQEMPPPLVEFVHPVKQEITEWDEFTGRFEAVQSVEVRARVSGLLEKIHFTDGQMIKEGDLLFTIDPKPFEASLKAAEAALAKAVAAADLARANYKRGQQLVERNAIAREEVDVRKGTLDEAEAAVSAAQAQEDIARLDLGYTEVRSPIAGRLADRFVTVGNLISGGTAQSTLLTTIVSFDPIYCRIDADENTMLRYLRGNGHSKNESTASLPADIPVELAVEGDQGYPRKGSINFVNNTFDSGTATLRLRAVLDNKDGFLSPGMFARVRLSGSGKRMATLIPDVAIQSRQDLTYVLTVDENNIVRSTPVTLGTKQERLRVIESELPLDTRVLVSGFMMARPDAPATPKPFEDPAAAETPHSGQK